MKENAGFPFSHYAPGNGCVCWYCHAAGVGFARFIVGQYRASYFAPLTQILAEVCPACEPKARNGERGNG